MHHITELLWLRIHKAKIVGRINIAHAEIKRYAHI